MHSRQEQLSIGGWRQHPSRQKGDEPGQVVHDTGGNRVGVLPRVGTYGVVDCAPGAKARSDVPKPEMNQPVTEF